MIQKSRSRLSGLGAAGVAVAAGALLVAACSSSGSPSASGTSPSSGGEGTSSAALDQAKAAIAPYEQFPTQITVTAPLKSPPPKGKTVVWLLATESPTNAQIGDGLKAAATAIGWKFDEISYQGANPATLQAAFAAALTKHPVMVAEAGQPESEWGANTISDYQKAGVLIVANAVFPFQPYPNVTGVPTGAAAAAANSKLMANWFAVNSQGKGNALWVSVPDYPIVKYGTDQFTSDLASVCPSCTAKVVNVTLQQLAAGQLISTSIDALRADPSAKYLLFGVGDFATGIDSALAAAGLEGKVQVAGNAGDTDQFAGLRKGTQLMWTGYNTQYQGYQTLDITLRHMEGMPPQPGDTVGPTAIITKANVGNTQTLWQYPTDALQQFVKLWQG